MKIHNYVRLAERSVENPTFLKHYCTAINTIQPRLDEKIQDHNIIDVTADIVVDKFKDCFDQTRRGNIDYSIGNTV